MGYRQDRGRSESQCRVSRGHSQGLEGRNFRQSGKSFQRLLTKPIAPKLQDRQDFLRRRDPRHRLGEGASERRNQQHYAEVWSGRRSADRYRPDQTHRRSHHDFKSKGQSVEREDSRSYNQPSRNFQTHLVSTSGPWSPRDHLIGNNDSKPRYYHPGLAESKDGRMTEGDNMDVMFLQMVSDGIDQSSRKEKNDAFLLARRCLGSTMQDYTDDALSRTGFVQGSAGLSINDVVVFLWSEKCANLYAVKDSNPNWMPIPGGYLLFKLRPALVVDMDSRNLSVRYFTTFGDSSRERILEKQVQDDISGKMRPHLQDYVQVVNLDEGGADIPTPPQCFKGYRIEWRTATSSKYYVKPESFIAINEVSQLSRDVICCKLGVLASSYDVDTVNHIEEHQFLQKHARRRMASHHQASMQTCQAMVPSPMQKHEGLMTE